MKDGVCKLAWLCVPVLAAFLTGCPQDTGNTIRAETVAILYDGLELRVGDEKELGVRVLPLGASDYKLLWTVNDETFASVEQGGTVTAKAEGAVTVTVTLRVNGADVNTDQVDLTVLPKGALEDSIDPVLLFKALRGQSVRTGGWADNANGGAGIRYANPAAPIIICDCDDPNPADKLGAFTAALDLRNQPVFIIVCGDVDFSGGTITDEPGHFPGITDYRVTQERRFDIRSPDTTIIGINNARLMFGGLRINGNMNSGTMNVIIRNVTFWDARDTRPSPGLDGLLLTGNSRANDHGYDWPTGVWVDHVKFSSGATGFLLGGDWHDTLLNVTLGEITVSRSRFTNANEVLLVGGGEGGEFPAGATEDELLWLRSRRRVTLHNNYFHDARTRMPRTRGTQTHMYNNFFRAIGATGGIFGGGYVMGPGYNAHFVVQNNLFDAPVHQNRILNTGFPGFHTTVVWSENNVGVGVLAGGRVSNRDRDSVKPWEPSNFYDYAVTADVQGLRTSIPERAGPTLTTIADFLVTPGGAAD